MQRSLVFVCLLLVAATSIAAGPLGTESTRIPTTETANVTVESIPSDNISLEPGRFGSGRYHLDAPPAVVNVGAVTGTPILRYVVDIPDLWVTMTNRYGLAGRAGRLTMRPSPVTVSPDHVDRDSYNATVAVWIRTGTHERDIVQRDVTVEVAP